MRRFLAAVTVLASASAFGFSEFKIAEDVKVLRGSHSVQSNRGLGANRITHENVHLEVKLKSYVDLDTKVEVRWWLFERGVGASEKSLRVVGGGGSNVDVRARKTASFRSGGHDFNRSEAQSQAFLPGARLTLGEIERYGKYSEGVKFAGYGVQLLKGGQVLDSKFSADNLAAHVGASGVKAGWRFGPPPTPPPPSRKGKG